MNNRLAYFFSLLGTLLFFNATYYLTKNLTLSLSIQLLFTSVILFYFRKSFKFKIRFDLFSILSGLVIFALWTGLEGRYPLFGQGEAVSFNIIDIILKLIIGVVLIPVIEEFFTRFFLSRWIISPRWEDVSLGAYRHMSFIFTTLFFGLSHSRWLPGLLTGVILNALYYRKKNIESCILAHAVANLALGLYVVYFSAWQFWS